METQVVLAILAETLVLVIAMIIMIVAVVVAPLALARAAATLLRRRTPVAAAVPPVQSTPLGPAQDLTAAVRRISPSVVRALSTALDDRDEASIEVLIAVIELADRQLDEHERVGPRVRAAGRDELTRAVDDRLGRTPNTEHRTAGPATRRSGARPPEQERPMDHVDLFVFERAVLLRHVSDTKGLDKALATLATRAAVFLLVEPEELGFIDLPEGVRHSPSLPLIWEQVEFQVLWLVAGRDHLNQMVDGNPEIAEASVITVALGTEPFWHEPDIRLGIGGPDPAQAFPHEELILAWIAAPARA